MAIWYLLLILLFNQSEFEASCELRNWFGPNIGALHNWVNSNKLNE